jgi:hypothetical protein
LFFDSVSEKLFNEIPESSLARSKVFLNIERFEIGQSYVTAKVQNRYGDKVNINIQGGRPGIDLQKKAFSKSKIMRQEIV